MNDERISKTQLRAYLLGELEETVAEPLEERCFTEPDWHEALLAEREDLLDAWACGELTPAEAEKLEARMIALPALRARAAFARSLHQHLSQSSFTALSPVKEASAQVLPVRVSAAPFWSGLLRWRWSLAVATAIALALVGGLIWNAWRSRPMPAPLLVHQPSPSAVVGTDVPRLESGPAREKPKAVARQTPERNEKGIVSFVLAAALVRGTENTPELTVPADAKTLRLQLELPTEEARPQRAALQTSDGTVVWQSSLSRLRMAGEMRYVECDVPMASLKADDYQLRLTQADGTSVVYFFLLKKT